jgi:hypothetical protein
MAAGAVGPKQRPELFFGTSPLQKKLALIIENEDGEGAMEQTFSVMAPLPAGVADHPVLGVDNDQ